jgi:hypothetical protein
MLAGAFARMACAWRSIFTRAGASPGKMTTASDHIAPVRRNLPPSIRSVEGDRTGLEVFTGKVAALVSASPGVLGGIRAQIALQVSLNKMGFRNGPGGVKSPVSTSPSIGAPRLSITSVVVAGLLLPSVVGTQAATSCHQKKR